MTDNSPFDEFFDFDEPDDDLDGFDGNAVDDGFGGFAEYGTAYSSEGTTSYSAAADDSGNHHAEAADPGFQTDIHAEHLRR